MREACKFNVWIHNGNILMPSVTKVPGVSSILLFSGSGINFPRQRHKLSAPTVDLTFTPWKSYPTQPDLIHTRQKSYPARLDLILGTSLEISGLFFVHFVIPALRVRTDLFTYRPSAGNLSYVASVNLPWIHYIFVVNVSHIKYANRRRYCSKFFWKKMTRALATAVFTSFYVHAVKHFRRVLPYPTPAHIKNSHLLFFAVLSVRIVGLKRCFMTDCCCIFKWDF